MRLDRYTIAAALTAALLLLPQAATAQYAIVPGTGDSVVSRTVEGPLYFVRGNGEIVLTENVDTESVTSGGVSCGDSTNGTYTTENSYYRAFDLSQYPEITGDFEVSMVSAGVWINEWFPELPEQEGTIRIYNLTNPPTGGVIAAGDLELVAEQNFGGIITTGAGGEGFVADVAISGTFSNTSWLAVEMFLPNGNPEVTGEADYFDIRQGENDEGVVEGSVLYLASASCGITDPTDIQALGPFDPSGWVLTVTGTTTGGTSSEDGALARAVSLGSAYPNPAFGRTAIPFELEEAAHVQITVHDALGRQVAVVSDATFGAGEQEVGVDVSALPAGVYFYRAQVGGETFTRRFVVLQ